MRYAIVGTGNIGSALAHVFARAGIDVSIANTRGPESISELTAPLAPVVRAVTLSDAVKCDVILLAIPFLAVEEFGRLLPDWTGKIVIDTTNAFWVPDADEVLRGRLSSEYVAETLPGADVVKAFNQLPADVLAEELPAGQGKRVIFVSSNSEDAGARIAHLVDDLGFASIDVGRLDEGGRLIQARNALVLRNLIERPLR